jgi:uncharacterized protein YciI
MTTTRKYFFIIYKRGPKWIPGKSVWEQSLLHHTRFLQQLLDQGKLEFAGPFLDDSGGVAVLTFSGEAEAKEILSQEPAILEGIFEAELHPFQFTFDSATGSSDFSQDTKM